MGLEIEHKYKVINNDYQRMCNSKCEIAQGYLSRDKERTVRVRIKNDSAFLTIKGITSGCVRNEYEYPIPVDDAELLLKMCLPIVIYKTRYMVEYAGNVWEVDEFHGEHEGLVLAEIELPNPEYKYLLPPFVGENVTADSRYYNSNLSIKSDK